MPLIESMADDIRNAKSRVWMESYIIADDAAGRAIAEALIERVAAGLDVRLMYDAIGSLSTPQAYFDRLTAAGVHVHAFHSIRANLWRFPFLDVLNRRNHRKLLVIDDRLAYFGGMNIVDQRGIVTAADAKLHHLPASAGWRDLHARLTGPTQAEIAAEFERLWDWKHLGRAARRTPWPIKQMLSDERQEAIFCFASRPLRKTRRVARVFVPLIRRARR